MITQTGDGHPERFWFGQHQTDKRLMKTWPTVQNKIIKGAIIGPSEFFQQKKNWGWASLISISFYAMAFFSSFFPWKSPISVSKMEVICLSLKSLTILRRLRFLLPELLLMVTLLPVLVKLLLALLMLVSWSLLVFCTEFWAVLAALMAGWLSFV